MKTFRISRNPVKEPSRPSVRKLATIMFSDIVGFSYLMGENEASALEQITKWKIIHHSFINKHNGKAIKEIGDGYLVTFENCFDAVCCALDIKDKLAVEEHLKVRIGIHLAEIIFQNNDILGDGVNIASRIEQDAHPGCIHISDPVYMNLKNKKEFHFQPKGLKTFRNIENPIQIYEVNRNGPKIAKPQLNDRADLSIALIPFRTKTRKESEFAEEIMDGLYDRVSNPEGVALLSSSRIESILNSGKDIYSELLEYRAKFILEGRVVLKSKQLTVSVRLSSVETSYQIGSNTFISEKTSNSFSTENLINAISGFITENLQK